VVGQGRGGRNELHSELMLLKKCDKKSLRFQLKKTNGENKTKTKN
jgi:hypothetical protein